MAIATNKDYLVAALSKFNVSEADIDLMLIDSDLDPDEAPDPRACKLAIYNSMSAILPLANVSESGYSVSWNMDGLKLWYQSLCSELGKPNVIKPKIRNRSNLW